MRSPVWRAAARWLLLAAGLAILNGSLSFVNIWPTPGIRWDRELSIEAAACALGLALLAWSRRTPGPTALRRLSAAWVVLVLVHYGDITTQALYGRQLNLYWDIRQFSAVGAMLAVVANPWLVVGVLAGLVVVPLLLYVPIRWSFDVLVRAAAEPAPRLALALAAGFTAIIYAVQPPHDPEGLDRRVVRFSPSVLATIGGQARMLAQEVTGIGIREPAPPPDIASNLTRLGGTDVLVVFLESYGAVSWDRPELRTRLGPSRSRLDAELTAGGRSVVSAFAESPTFGGGSWLAHVSFLSGTEVRDQDTNMRLMAQQRDTLVKVFGRHGYDTVAIMPGMQTSWPEGAFYGFSRIFGAEALAYQGPTFGWWDMTDQFGLARLDQLAIAPRPRRPVFVFFPTVSTHTPFAPTPPYQPDWSRMLSAEPYDPADMDRAWSDVPDWENLGPSYGNALAYATDTITGYLRLRRDRDFVLVLLGDHQPPALVSGEGASWEVPVHVITSRPAILERLQEHGFRPGLPPHHPAATTIHGLMPILLDAFGDPD